MSTLSEKLSFQALVNGHVFGWEAAEEQLYTGRFGGLQQEAAGGENTAPSALELPLADHFAGVWTQTAKSHMCQQCGKCRRLTNAGNLPTGITTSYFSVAQMSTFFFWFNHNLHKQRESLKSGLKKVGSINSKGTHETHALSQNITSKVMGNWALWMTQGWGHGKSHSVMVKPSKH